MSECITHHFKKMIEDEADKHKWSIECTCNDQDVGDCFWHLDDTEKAKQSYIQGATMMHDILWPIIKMQRASLVDMNSWLKRMSELEWQDKNYAPKFKQSCAQLNDCIEQTDKMLRGDG